jgi:hypothetical protein
MALDDDPVTVVDRVAKNTPSEVFLLKPDGIRKMFGGLMKNFSFAIHLAEWVS